MKLSLTDTFLFSLYEILESTEGVFSLFPKTLIEATNPELAALRREYRKRKRKRDFRQMVYYLKKKGYIKTSSQWAILITPKGAEKVLKIKLKEDQKRRRKDGKWIMVIFDIPETKRRNRDIFRDFLVVMGYQKLQESVWICPYDVFRETETLIEEYNLEKYTRMFLIDEVMM